MSALLGTFVKLATLADGSVRIVLDMQCTLSEVAAMGLTPGVPFGIARITGESTLSQNDEVGRRQENGIDTTSTPDLPSKTVGWAPPIKPGNLCILACTFCTNPVFQKWLECEDEEHAKAEILRVCKITSRKELDTNSNAALIFHDDFRIPFLSYFDASRTA